LGPAMLCPLIPTLFPYTTLFRSSMVQVLMICTGNTCRSPMAEAILRALLTPELAGVARVVSAGTGAAEGVPATPLAIQVCAEGRSEEHTSELQSRGHLVCRLLLE